MARQGVDDAARLLRAKGQELEATVVLLPDRLRNKERDAAREALVEAAAILCDAAEQMGLPDEPTED